VVKTPTSPPPGKQPPEHPCLLFRDKQPAFLANAGLFVFWGATEKIVFVLSPFLGANNPDRDSDHEKNREQNLDPVNEYSQQHEHR
jgi:hypothetical protein